MSSNPSVPRGSSPTNKPKEEERTGTLSLESESYSNPLWQRFNLSKLLAQYDTVALSVNEARYVFPADWWNSWCDYTGYENRDRAAWSRIWRATEKLDFDVNSDIVIREFSVGNIPLPNSETFTPAGPRPGVIDFTSLLANPDDATYTGVCDHLSGPRLRTGLIYDVDYVLIPDAVYRALTDWYSTKGPALVRRAISRKTSEGAEVMVDLYPELKRFQNDSVSNNDNMETSSESEDEKDDADVSEMDSSRSGAPPCPCSVCSTLCEKRCMQCRNVYYCSVACQKQDWARHRQECLTSRRHHQSGEPFSLSERSGVVGLQNFGNTCFMNSSLQALSAVAPLTLYCLKDQWKDELNTNNPLGSGGVLARAYAHLMHEMWGPGTSPIRPWALKQAISGFQERFYGFAQHDAQELLQYLLDGLHEDLNRVKERKYYEDEESNGRPDAEVARLSWEKFCTRNNSVVQDLFAGQLKSTLVCPDCRRVSVKFDPFTMLPLPLSAPPLQQVHFLLFRRGFDATDPAAHSPFGPRDSWSARFVKLWSGSPEPHFQVEDTANRCILDRPAAVVAPQVGAYRQGDLLSAIHNPFVEEWVLEMPPFTSVSEFCVQVQRLCGTSERLFLQKAHNGSLIFQDILPNFPEMTANLGAYGLAGAQSASAARGSTLLVFEGSSPQPVPFKELNDSVRVNFLHNGGEGPQGTSVEPTEATVEPATEGPFANRAVVALCHFFLGADDAPVSVSPLQQRLNGPEASRKFTRGSLLRQRDPLVPESLANAASGVASSSVDSAAPSLELSKNGTLFVPVCEGSTLSSLRMGIARALRPYFLPSLVERVCSDLIEAGLATESPEFLEAAVTVFVASRLVIFSDSVLLPTFEGDGSAISGAVGPDSSAESAEFSDFDPHRLRVGGKVASRFLKPNLLTMGNISADTMHSWLPLECFVRGELASYFRRSPDDASLPLSPSPMQPLAGADARPVDWQRRSLARQVGVDAGGDSHSRLYASSGSLTTRSLLLQAAAIRGTLPAAAHAVDAKTPSGTNVPFIRTTESALSALAHLERPALSLRSCFEFFRQVERLDKDNQWYCSHCRAFVCASKTLEIWSLPSVLVLHLKRFNHHMRRSTKLDDFVDFPLEGLDLTDFQLAPHSSGSPASGDIPLDQDNRMIYDCVSVVHHYGSPYGGHYVAHAKHQTPNGQEWFLFDDSHASKATDLRSIVSSSAYCLIYQRRQ